MKEVEEAMLLLKPSSSKFVIKSSGWYGGYEFDSIHDMTPKPHDIQMKGMTMQDYLITRLVTESAQEYFNTDTMKWEIQYDDIRRNVFHHIMRTINTFVGNHSKAKNQWRTKMFNFINHIHYESGSNMVELMYGVYKAIIQDVPIEKTDERNQNVMGVLEFIREKYDKHDYTKKRNKRRGR